jgi:EF hand
VAVEDSQALFQQMDSNSDGSLSSDELAQGLKQVLPPPPSTVNFAQSRGGKGDGALSETEFEAGRPAPPEGAEQAQKPGGLQGPLGIGDPPPAGAQPNTTASTDPLDTNQDGVVSELERLAGALKTLSTADTSGNEALSEVAKLAQQLDQQISTSWLATQSTSTLNTTA